MALNTSKCNCLTPLYFKRLNMSLHDSLHQHCSYFRHAFCYSMVLGRKVTTQHPIWHHIVRGMALCQHRHRRLRQLLSQQQIHTLCIVFHVEPRPQTFLLALSSFYLRPSWHLFVCKKHVSWQTWQKFPFLCALSSSFLAQLARPASTIMKLAVPSQLLWPMRSVVLVVFVYL